MSIEFEMAIPFVFGQDRRTFPLDVDIVVPKKATAISSFKVVKASVH